MNRSPGRTKGINISVRKIQKSNGKYVRDVYEVRGWKEGTKYPRKYFNNEASAKDFAAAKRLEITNEGAARRLLMTTLSERELAEAESAFKALGGTYTVSQAVAFFLDNHRAPEFVISLNDATKVYLDACHSAGIRTNTIRQKKSVLTQLSSLLDNPSVHEISTIKAEGFLRGLRAKDGVTKASRKTWNNYRNDLNHFFKWAAEKDFSSSRPYTFNNPVDSIKSYSAKQVADQRKPIAITPPEKLQRRMSALMRWQNGTLAKYFALTYFAGIRPDGEMGKLAAREKELINIETRTIHIPADVSKTKEIRQVKITDNLLLWLQAYADYPILPTNHSRLLKRVRKAFKISHDETRHSFISYHVALHRSIGEAALQAGNSESVVKKHYLNLRPPNEGKAFFSIVPNP